MTAAAKSRTVCLRDHEARRLLEHGRVRLVRAIKLSDEYTRGCDPGLALLAGNHAAHLRDGIGLVWWPYAGSPEVPMPPDKVAEYSPFGPIGTRLACREAYRLRGTYTDACDRDEVAANPAHFDVTYNVDIEWNTDIYGKIRSAATMPSWAIRLHAENAGVVVKRCRDVTTEEARMMGIPGHDDPNAVLIHSHAAWERNAWLWLCDARRVTE